MTGHTAPPSDGLAGAWMKRPLQRDRFWVDVDALPLQLEELETFLRSLPPSRVFMRNPNREVGQGSPPRLEFGAEPLREQLMRQSLHVVAVDLHEDDPRFADALARFHALIAPVLKASGVEMIESSVGIFLASGKTVTPFHADLEHNFLQQIYGAKHLYVFPREDYEIFPNARRERMCVNRTSDRFLPFEERFQTRAMDIHLTPGVASYQPPFAPHWVETEEGISLSLLFSVYTSGEDRIRLVNYANHQMRKLSMSPRAVGQSAFWDAAKYRGASLAKSIIRSLRPARVSRGRVR